MSLGGARAESMSAGRPRQRKYAPSALEEELEAGG